MTTKIAPAAEFSSAEAASYLGVEPATLEIWRCTRRHIIPYLKIGRNVRYRKSDLDQWLASRMVGGESHADTGAGAAA